MHSRLWVATAAMLVACARVEAPPGGEQDTSPPQIIETVPADQTVIEPTDEPVIFRFDENISERGVSDASVMVSPETGKLRVKRDGKEIRVQIEGGWQAGKVYRVIVLPGLRNRFGVERKEPAELIFSTGSALVPTVIAGLVIDRITGRPANQAIVQAISRADSVIYATAVDSSAFFALRYLPVAAYEIRAFIDQNRNRIRDPAEPRALSQVVPLNLARDTFTMQLWLVPADTTPPLVQRAEFRDSLQVRITTDDYLEPAAELQFVEVRLLQLPDSTAVDSVRLMSVKEFEALRRPPGDSARPPLPAAAIRIPGDTTTLPAREIVLIPGRPLRPKERFLVIVGALTNITGLTGGGGRVQIEVPDRPAAPPRRDTTLLRSPGARE